MTAPIGAFLRWSLLCLKFTVAESAAQWNLADMKNSLVVIGANAAGLAAALQARRLAPELEITVLESTGDISWGACGIPFVIGDPEAGLERLGVKGVEEFRQRGIQIALWHKVEELDLDASVIRGDVAGGSRREFEIPFDSLIVATGAGARLPVIPGLPADRMYPLRALDDVRRAERDLAGAKRVTVLGGGAIGLEMADALLRLGKQVQLVELAELPLVGFPRVIRERVADRLRQRGVELHTGTGIRGAETSSGGLQLHLETTTLESDLLLVSAGVSPRTEFAQKAGLRCSTNGALIVDHTMKTSHSKVWAAGDCAIRPGLDGQLRYNPQALEARRGGRVAGENAARPHKNPSLLPPSPGTLILECCGLELARCGILGDDALPAMPVSRGSGLLGQKLEEPGSRTTNGVRRAFVKSVTQAGSMGRSGDLLVSLEADSNMKLRGGALLAEGRGALRINVIAALLQMGASAVDLAALDLAYSPPFGPVRDPLISAAIQLMKE